MNILLIDSSARVATSDSRKLGERLATRFGEQSGATMVRRDLNEGLHLITEPHLEAFNTPFANRTQEQNQLNKISDSLISELRDCDRLIITMPMYNYNIPTTQKMWQDLVMREGETFRTVSTGVVGLLKNKKAYIIITTGGVAHTSADHLLVPLTKLFLGGMGIEDQTYIHADCLAFDLDNSLAKAYAQIDSLEI